MAVDYDPSKPGIQTYEDRYGSRDAGKKRVQEKIKFLQSQQYDPEKDYSSDIGKLFGSSKDDSSPLYYGGANDKIFGALSDRLGQRQQKTENRYGSTGFYESYATGMGGGDSREQEKRMYRRNNAVEDMFRKGYSQEQINAHTSGERNVLEEGPNFEEYKKAAQSAAQGEGIFGVKNVQDQDWYKSYFTGVPDEVAKEAEDLAKPPEVDPVADVFPQPPEPGSPAGKGGTGGSGGGKGGGQPQEQPRQTTPFRPIANQEKGVDYMSSSPSPSQRGRGGMYRSSPAGLGTGYYGGMGSGGRQFGGGSYFGGFGGQYSQPSYGGKGGGRPQQPMRGGFSQPYQQSYQQPSYGGYSSFGGYGGSGGGIGGFYQPMGYGGYR